MAYLDLELATGAGYAVTSAPPLPLEELERQAVLASRNDAARTLRTSGRLDRFKALVFGHRPAGRLANERLEAIRRYAVLYRLKGAGLDPAEAAAACSKGISAAKLASVRSMVDQWRTPVRDGRRAGHVMRAAVAMGLALWLYGWLAKETDDSLIAVILVLVSLLTIVAVASPKSFPR